ncbi:MAG TPA: superoxide dismutase [Cu-Zn] SodC [Methylophilaceae bacterium]|nr:superoxide dismutase [Cu-Zn] SodC [Methylophilaceae bacterium]
MRLRNVLLASLLGAALPVFAAEQIVVIRAISDDGVGKMIGTVKLSDTDKGLVLDPDLGELTPGSHGFHIHENPSCDAAEKDGKKTAGAAAGGHYDPAGTGDHKGPQGHGHLGDLPALVVKDDGSATSQLVAPRLRLDQVHGRALMIHEGGDNYSDQPKPLGGGAGRIACGIIE